MKRTTYISIRGKLGDERGASLSIALLLFLACAMVSAVILVSATAAAGRLDSVAKMDRRYYSVQSAAQVVSKDFDGATFTITREWDDYDSNNVKMTYSEPDDSSKLAFVQRLTRYVIFGSNTIPSSSIPKDNAIAKSSEMRGIKLIYQLSATEKAIDINNTNIIVSFPSKFSGDGTVILDISNEKSSGTNANSQAIYHALVTLAAQVTDNEQVTVHYRTESDGSIVSYKHHTRTTTVEWDVVGITSYGGGM